jgi:hypothetical protein
VLYIGMYSCVCFYVCVSIALVIVVIIKTEFLNFDN